MNTVKIDPTYYVWHWSFQSTNLKSDLSGRHLVSDLMSSHLMIKTVFSEMNSKRTETR